MDLTRVKAHARIATRTARLSQPVRSLLWRLMAPYFQAFAGEIEVRLERLERRIGMQPDAVEDHGLALEINGLRKDVRAVAHRLAGIEEELAAAAGDGRLPA